MSEPIVEEEQTGNYLSNWVSYEAVTQDVKDQPRIRILGRLEGFMNAGIIVSNEYLDRILEEQRFSTQEAVALGKCQLKGIRKGLDLNYNTVQEFWEAHAERIGNVSVIWQYNFMEEKDG